MSNTFIEALEKQYNYTFTQNGALAHKSTGSKVYDLFALGAAFRDRSDEDCILLFKNAFEEDADLALKCLFYIRDCRGGQGERRFFRVCYKWLAEKYPDIAIKNLEQVSEFGRWDDLFCLIGTSIEKEIGELVKYQLKYDMSDAIDNKAISLLGKWMPSENASSVKTKEKAIWIRKYLGMNSKQYRKMLSKLREQINVLEKLMSANRWDEIDFSKIPSKAGLIYRNAFARRDILAERYKAFIKSDKTKVNADVLYPYEIVREVFKEGKLEYTFDEDMYTFSIDDTQRAAINKYWENQKDYLNGASPSMMCVIDTSGSMYGNPINVAISLGLYCAERMTGPFANKYISFSSFPQLIETEGIDFVDKVYRIYKKNLCEDTNIEAVFDLFLNTVLSGKAKAEDLPKTLVIISDMEINYMSYWSSTDETLTEMERIRKKWESYGLTLPRLVYWNVHAMNNNILDSGPNVTFVSGCSPILFKMVLTGKQGFDLMLETLLSERYKKVHI